MPAARHRLSRPGLRPARSKVRPGLGRALAKGNWSVLDQVLSSGTNFLLAFVLVRRFGPEPFGAFSLGVVVYVLAIGLARALTGEPLVIRFTRTPGRAVEAARCAVGCAFLLGCALGGLCALAAALAGGPLRGVLAALALTFPLLLVQDAGRMSCFALGRPRSAAVNDGAWALAAAGGLALLVTLDVRSLTAFVAAWLVPGALAGLLVLRQLRLWPAPARVATWLRGNRRLSLPLCGVYLLGFAPAYLVFALAPAVASLSELGLARASYVPFAVFGVFMQGVGLFLLPAAAGRGTHATWRFARQASAGLGGLAIVWSAVILLGLPEQAGHWLLGAAWEETGTTRSLFGIGLVFQALGTAPLIALRSLQLPGRLLRMHAVTAPLVLGSGIVLTGVGGAEGLALSILLGDIAIFLLGWWQLRRAVRQEPSDAPEPLVATLIASQVPEPGSG